MQERIGFSRRPAAKIGQQDPHSGDGMPKVSKFAEKGLTLAAKAGWAVFDRLNSISPNASFTPKWSDKPLLKSYQKEKTAPWMATHDRFALPQVRSGDPPADHRRQAAA